MIKTIEKWLKYGAYTYAIYDILKFTLKRLKQIDRDIQKDLHEIELETSKETNNND